MGWALSWFSFVGLLIFGGWMEMDLERVVYVIFVFYFYFYLSTLVLLYTCWIIRRAEVYLFFFI